MRNPHQPKESVRLFKSDFLEQFTHVNPIMPLVLWAPVIAFLFYRSFMVHGLALSAFLMIGLMGLLTWTLVEYVLHRFAFHYPAKSRLGKRFVYLMHGLHHDDPNDGTRLVMPPVPALIYAFVLYSLFKLVIPVAQLEAFFAFFLIGYLCYDYIHYYVHHFNPKNPIGKYLKRYHLIHHFTDHDAKWGVSSPLWDHVFRTVELRKEIKRSEPRLKKVSS